jgi:hypothetical protein
LIYDDSDSQSEYFLGILDRRVKYFHESNEFALSIGEKRNRLITKAQGQWIAHIDDDDFYGSNYLSHLLGKATSESAELVYFRTWFYINEEDEIGCYSSQSVLPRLEGWGFTFMYNKEIATKNPFPKNNWEDHYWFQSAVATAKYLGIDDSEGIVFKSVHKSNTSRFPNNITSNPDLSKIPHVVNALREIKKLDNDFKKEGD